MAFSAYVYGYKNLLISIPDKEFKKNLYPDEYAFIRLKGMQSIVAVYDADKLIGIGSAWYHDEPKPKCLGWIALHTLGCKDMKTFAREVWEELEHYLKVKD